MSLQKLIEEENAKLFKTGDLNQRIKTLAWWVKHADTEAGAIECINDFVTQQRNVLLDGVVEMVERYQEFCKMTRDECLAKEQIIIAYDMDSRQVAENKIISQLQTLKK